jgi:hypothetical protein
MPNIDPLASPIRDGWNPDVGSSRPSTLPAAPTPAAASRAELDATYGSALEHLPDFSIALPAITARLDPVATKLDQLQATMSGPYSVMHFTIESGTQFRMASGYNRNNATATSPDGEVLAAVAAKAGLSSSALVALQQGRGDPGAVVKLTQALIDAGHLSGEKDKSLAAQIHDLQWRFGVGVDCAGYVYQAVVAIHGNPAKLGLKATGFENFTGLPYNSHFETMAPEKAQAGDIVVLKGRGRVTENGQTTFDPGHNLIVRSRSLASQTGESVAERWPAAKAFVEQARVHVLEVDSAFGAGPKGDVDGGVRRDVILYNETTKEWCTCRDTRPPKVSVGPVPYGAMALTGFFRPKGST